jgi:hypothetical protein
VATVQRWGREGTSSVGGSKGNSRCLPGAPAHSPPCSVANNGTTAHPPRRRFWLTFDGERIESGAVLELQLEGDRWVPARRIGR